VTKTRETGEEWRVPAWNSVRGFRTSTDKLQILSPCWYH